MFTSIRNKLNTIINAPRTAFTVTPSFTFAPRIAAEVSVQEIIDLINEEEARGIEDMYEAINSAAPLDKDSFCIGALTMLVVARHQIAREVQS